MGAPRHEDVVDATGTSTPDDAPIEETAPADDGGLAVEGAEEAVVEAPEAGLAEVERQRDEYLDHLRRERAEFENFRKRITRERMDALDRGAEQVVVSLLGVLDHFGFALAAAEQSDDEQLAKGVRMVHAELVSALHKAGLEEIPGEGATFDPHCHEAVAEAKADEPVAEPVVVEVMRPGYRFKGRVLRPAAVKVAH